MRGNRRADNGEEIRLNLVSQSSPHRRAAVPTEGSEGWKEGREGREVKRVRKHMSSLGKEEGEWQKELLESQGRRSVDHTSALWILSRWTTVKDLTFSFKFVPCLVSVSSACVFSLTSAWLAPWVEACERKFGCSCYTPRAPEFSTFQRPGNRTQHGRMWKTSKPPALLRQKINSHVDFSVIAWLSRAGCSLILLIFIK